VGADQSLDSSVNFNFEGTRNDVGINANTEDFQYVGVGGLINF